VLELADCLGLDLPNSLARYRKLLAHFLQRVVAVHAETKAHPHDALQARGFKVPLLYSSRPLIEVSSVAMAHPKRVCLPQQLQQLRYVRRDPPRLVLPRFQCDLRNSFGCT